jgi:hypothetical protein
MMVQNIVFARERAMGALGVRSDSGISFLIAEHE